MLRATTPGPNWSWCYVDEVAFVLDTLQAPHENLPAHLEYEELDVEATVRRRRGLPSVG
jgi:hypothetical protein